MLMKCVNLGTDMDIALQYKDLLIYVFKFGMVVQNVREMSSLFIMN